ncbi:MAG: nuclear transport factor 2 family protein [Acidobacteria bacterium]|nr:nuclear transport factor 2 family protein [Acidobacteriota bacterium]
MSRSDIEELVHRYSDAVVHADREQWASTWTDDAHWQLGETMRAEGRDEIVKLWVGAMSTFEAVVQTVLNGSAVTDDFLGIGSGRWYIQEHGKTTQGEAFMLLSYYDDTYVRIGDDWLFSSRSLVSLYQGPSNLSADFAKPSASPDA